MDIVVKGRNVEVPEHYRTHVSGKLSRVKRYDHKAIRYDVELFHERNPRQSKSCQRVEITGQCRGQTVRAEASGPDFYAALDTAVSKLENRLRRVADRRKVRHARRQLTSVAEATAPLAAVLASETPFESQSGPRSESESGSQSVSQSTRNGQRAHPEVAQRPDAEEIDYQVPTQRWESPDLDEPGRIVREKEHPADPMTVDQALYEMELVGHDFYLFSDADSGRPSVVYRRKGFHYGVIQLV